MMRPYIAILIDSFWEALGNKVLWALLLGWSFILAGLFPFGYVSESSYRLSSFDIQNKTRLIEKLSRGAKGQGPKDVQAVASLLKPEFATRLQEVAEKKAGEQLNEREMAQALNAALSSAELYSEDLFPTAKRRQRLEGLIEQFPQGLSKTELEQLNRELLQLVFPLELNQPRGEQLWIGYAGFKIGEPLPVSRRQISQFFEPMLLTLIIKLGLGVVAVFVALVVTSPIIPETFRSSSLHLLLSKPISRIGLFLWKFFGATIFVLVNITFVLVGLYFIAGLRFEIWNHGLLGCIPLLLFVFMIFYSVSALAGLLWGNAIVSVVACIVFWVFCFGLGFVRDVMRAPIELNQQITRVRPVEEHLLSVTTNGELHVWNGKFSVWQPAIDSETRGSARTFGPMYDREQRTVVVKSFFRSPFGDLQARSRKLSLIRLDDERRGAATFAASATTERDGKQELDDRKLRSQQPESQGAAEPMGDEPPPASEATGLPNPFDSAWHAGQPQRPSRVGEGPASGLSLVRYAPAVLPASEEEENAGERLESTPPGRQMVDEVPRAESGVAQPASVAEARKEPRWIPELGPELPPQIYDVLETSDGMIAVSRNGLFRLTFENLRRTSAVPEQLFGLKLGWVAGGAFEDVTPAGYSTSNNTTASVLTDESGVALVSGGAVYLYASRGKKFETLATASFSELGLEGDGTEASLVEMNESFCVVARDGLPLTILTRNLEKKAVIPLPEGQKVRQLAWIPSTGQLSIVTHTGQLFRLDCETQELSPIRNPFQGQCTCVHWLDEHRVWLGVMPNRAHLVDLVSGAVEQNCAPRRTTFQTIYYWVVNPLYLINPKPAGLDNAMSYLLTGDQTATTQLITNDLSAAQIELQIWQPIVSNLAFLAVVLGISCVYVARREF
jgi:hypothetical protein